MPSEPPVQRKARGADGSIAPPVPCLAHAHPCHAAGAGYEDWHMLLLLIPDLDAYVPVQQLLQDPLHFAAHIGSDDLSAEISPLSAARSPEPGIPYFQNLFGLRSAFTQCDRSEFRTFVLCIDLPIEAAGEVI